MQTNVFVAGKLIAKIDDVFKGNHNVAVLLQFLYGGYQYGFGTAPAQIVGDM